MSPGQWGRERQASGPGAGSEVHAPGGLTDAGAADSAGGRTDRCWEGQVLCFAVVLDLSLECKKLLWQPPTLADVHIQEVLVARAGRCFVPEKVRAGLGCSCPVASSDEIFFPYFFLSFFFLFHFVEIFTAIGEEERGARGPPRERSKPRTHSSGSPRPQICSPDSPAHRTGNCPNMATPSGLGGPAGSCASSGVTPREGVIGCTLGVEGQTCLGDRDQ